MDEKLKADIHKQVLINSTSAQREDQRQHRLGLKWLSVSQDQKLLQASEASPMRHLHACIFITQAQTSV